MGAIRPIAALSILILAGCAWVEDVVPAFKAPPKAVQAPPSRPAEPPPKAPPAPVKVIELPPGSSVTVEKGDTVHAIARRHNVGVRELIEANRLKPPYGLQAGQHLVLPSTRDHVVEKGETVALIARRHNLDPRTLIELNNLAEPYTIRVGQRLKLPGEPGAPPKSAELAVASESLPPPEPPPSHAKASEPPPPPEPTPAAQPGPQPQAVAIPKPPPRAGKAFLWPVKGKVITAYGWGGKGIQNDGINIAAPRGTPVKAAENGVVVYAGNELKGFGSLLLIKHEGGWVTAYAHLDQLLVGRGDKVKRGQTIAKVGATGGVSAPQLHFEIRKGAKPVDPRDQLERS